MGVGGAGWDGACPGNAERSQLEDLIKGRPCSGSFNVVVLWSPNGAPSIPRPAAHWWNERMGPRGP